jgi:TldD protein
MTITRRQLLASAAFALPAARALAFIPERPSGRAVADAALQAAKAGGATYADVRLVRHRRQFLRTRDDHLIALTDADSYGVGVRVLKGGTWGFTGTPEVSPRGAQAAARRALLIAQANASLPHHAVRLAPEPAYVDSWQTPIEKDPFRISLDTKVRLLTDSAQAAKGAVPAVKLVRGTLAAVLEEKRFFSSEGSDIEQMIYRVSGGYIVTVTKTGDFETRRYEVAPASAGFEHI